MEECEEIVASLSKKPYEEPTLVERQDLLQIVEGLGASISEGGMMVVD
jgi:hypothetical protein